MENQNLEETHEEKKQRFEHRIKPFLAQLLAKKETQNNSYFLSEDRYSGTVCGILCAFTLICMRDMFVFVVKSQNQASNFYKRSFVSAL